MTRGFPCRFRTRRTRRTPPAGEGKGLAAGTLGLFGSTVIGLASTAPVYSLAATLGFVVLTVGEQAPIAFIIAFVPMLLIAFAYRELNHAVPDCGTTFTWATKAFGPWVGWLGGWGVAVAGIIVLANLAQIGGIYFWLLVGARPRRERVRRDPHGRGVHRAHGLRQLPRARDRREDAERAARRAVPRPRAVRGLRGRGTSSPAPRPRARPRPSSSWFNPFAFGSFDGFTEAVLLALFIYWGWDTCLALNEETKDPKRIPGRAAVLSTLILLVTYVGVTVAAMSYAGLGDAGMGLGNEATPTTCSSSLKDALFGPWAWLLVLAVMISAISSTQTTILPTARGTLAMAVYKALPKRFATVHPRYRTPGFSTLLMGVRRDRVLRRA